MAADKALLRYAGKTQIERAFDLLSRFCGNVFLAIRSDQKDLPAYAGYPQIHDTASIHGPLAGILSAFEKYPDQAWLVAACDLPFLGEDTLQYLIEHRNSAKLATAFISVHDGKPEPLCAIYEPGAYRRLTELVQQGIHCPRRALMNSDVQLLTAINSRALDNINTPDEYSAAAKVIGPS